MKKYKKYEIYDGDKPGGIFDDLPVIEAYSGKEAILKHFKSTGRNFKIKRSAGRDVLFKAQAFYEIDGKKYRDGNVIWYAIDYN